MTKFTRFLLLGLVGLSPAVAQLQPQVLPAKARIFYAMDAEALSSDRAVQQSIARRMVDGLVCGVTGRRDPVSAWKTLVTPEDKVGIKVSASGGTVSGTHPAVVNAIAQGLIEAGVPAKNIIVWDRNMEDLLAAGYRADSKLYRLEGIDPRTGYDVKSQLSAPVLGKLIWGDSKFGDRKGTRFSDLLSTGDQLSSQSFFAKILSTEVTKVINVPALTDSFSTGINGAIVNMTLFSIDNWRRFAKSSAAGDSYIAEIYADPVVKDKVVLTILDALVLQYAGGPFPNPNFAIDNFTLFASRDPVAIDATAMRLIEEVRKLNKMPSIKPMSAYIEAASQLGLGEYFEPRIEMVRVGVEGIR